MAGDVYYGRDPRRLRVFVVDDSEPGNTVSLWWTPENGWTNRIKGTPEQNGWIYVGDMVYDWD